MIDLESIAHIDELPSQIAFLSTLGVLDESEEKIEAAKKVYRRVYRRLHARAMRQKKREYRVRFEADDVERIAVEAAKHGLSRSGYIHKAALAYMNQHYLEPDPVQVGLIELFLSRAYSSIQRIEEGSRGAVESQQFEMLYGRIESMENEVAMRLRKPLKLVEYLRKALKEKPSLRKLLEELLLENHAYGD